MTRRETYWQAKPRSSTVCQCVQDSTAPRPSSVLYSDRMRLSQAKVVGDAKAISIVIGEITQLFQDRRETAGSIRVGEAVRRRKFPPDLEPDVGTGRLWIASGHFEVMTRDLRGWGKSSEMFIVKGDLAFRITRLSAAAPTAKKREHFAPETVTWEFSAVLKPNPAQLELLKSALEPEHQW